MRQTSWRPNVYWVQGPFNAHFRSKLCPSMSVGFKAATATKTPPRPAPPDLSLSLSPRLCPIETLKKDQSLDLSMAGRGRPVHALPVRGSPPSLLGRPPPPTAIHPADDPLLVRRAPVPSSILALEDRLAAQHRQIQVLLVDNQQLAASHVALKQDLSASKHELRLAAASAAETKAAKDAEVREVYERSLKAEAEVRALEGMRAELAQVRSDVQSLGAVRHELVEQLQGLKGQLSSARAEHKQADTVMAEIEIMRKEIQKGRSVILTSLVISFCLEITAVYVIFFICGFFDQFSYLVSILIVYS